VSLSIAERTLPQYCAWHKRYFPREPFRSFAADEGSFIQNKTLFVCQRCRQKAQYKPRRKESPIEELVAHSFVRQRFDFRQHFPLGEFVYDFAFPRYRILLETDGQVYHKNRPRGENTPGSREHTAKVNGWRLIHVKNGPLLAERARHAVVEAIEATRS
jgi:very-short-patch-repair endonuclease